MRILWFLKGLVLKFPLSLLVAASILLFTGYTGLRRYFDAGPSNDGNLPLFSLIAMSVFSFMTGVGGNAGLTSATNATAKSFPDYMVGCDSRVILPFQLTLPCLTARNDGGFGSFRFWAICFRFFYPRTTVFPRKYLIIPPISLPRYIFARRHWVFCGSSSSIRRAFKS